MKENNKSDNIYIISNGVLRPFHLGIPERIPPRRTNKSYYRLQHEERIKPGLYVISSNTLHIENMPFSYLHLFKPVDYIGYSYHVFRITQADIDTHKLNKVASN